MHDKRRSMKKKAARVERRDCHARVGISKIKVTRLAKSCFALVENWLQSVYVLRFGPFPSIQSFVTEQLFFAQEKFLITETCIQI